MNFTQNTLNIYNNYLFKHCNAVVPDFCTPQDSHSVCDKAHFAFVTPEASTVHRRIYGDLVCCTLLCVYSMLSAMRLDITYVLYLDIYIYTLLLEGIHTPDIHRRI